MTLTDLPAWAIIATSVLLICGGLLTLIGAIGFLRLPHFFARMHAPSMGNTLGAGCVLLASMIMSSLLLDRPVVHELLITVFVVISSPVTTMMVMRAAVYRTRVNAQRRQQRSADGGHQ